MKQGIKLHTINTNKFKTNLIAIFLSIPLTRENVTKNALVSSIIRRGCQKYKTQEEISKKLEEMYGAEFNCGLDKLGKNHVLKFYIESINDEFLPQDGENMLKQSIEILSEIVFNPLAENNGFNEEYTNQEKENVKQIIEAKKDNKARYALFRCVEEMFKDKPEGLYKYGYVEDLENIDAKNLYEYYKELIDTCKIDIFVSGKLENTNIEQLIEQDSNLSNLKEREPKFNINRPEEKKPKQEANNIEEKLDVTQGKLVIGYDVEASKEEIENEKFRYIGMLYNAILGGTATSKLFQNVREKASLAYTASSSFSYYTGNIFINAGIEIENFEKARDIIKEQMEAMKQGDFSEEDIENAKKTIVSNIAGISDEQDTEIIYFLGQELSEREVSLEKYVQFVQDVNKNEIEDFAKKIKINTIYFLRN
ncbi:MAG: insulinase family protein [Clostridia bacterium]|nr:insulinase family protein [Clostridia bacterium]